jgi:hypothetical protein
MGLRYDECFECHIEIVPRYGFVPICERCALACHQRYLDHIAWTKRLSAMGAMPGYRTKRAARLKAMREMGVAAVNDNGRAFGR